MKKQSEMDASCWRKGKTLDASNAEVSSVSEDGASGDTAFFKKHSNINGFRTPEQ